MSGKKNESKIKSILERRGLIRKVGDGEETLNDTIARYNPDIKPIFDTPDESAEVKAAPKQPVPGMTTPVFPEKEIEEEREEQVTAPVAPVTSAVNTPKFDTEKLEEELFIAAPPPPPEPRTYTPPVEQKKPAPPPPPAPVRENLSSFGNIPTQQSSNEPTYAPNRLQSENYAERYLNVNELYEALALKPRKTDSVYLIEEYLRTLPDSLPDSSRREIVNKIISASGFDYDLLMGDGVLRVKMLKEYAERFARHTDDYIAARQTEVEALERQLNHAKKQIETRRDLHKRQFFTIETEAQRLKEILTFISG